MPTLAFNMVKIKKDNRNRVDRFGILMSCSMKMSFDTLEEAQKTKNRPYICDYCGKYHVSSQRR